MFRRIGEFKFFFLRIYYSWTTVLNYKFHFSISLRLTVLTIIIILSTDAYHVILLLYRYGRTKLRRNDIVYPDLADSFFSLITLWVIGDSRAGFTFVSGYNNNNICI